MNHEKIVSKVVDFYFSSRDFNGIPLEDLYHFSGLPEHEFKAAIAELVRDRKIDLVYEGDIPNPHIKPFPAPEVEQQIIKLESYEIDSHIAAAEAEADEHAVVVGDRRIRFFMQSLGCCVYPTPEHLRKIVDWKRHSSRPFTLRLAVGEWQLRPYFFELGILAIYRNDPRYRYHTDDVTGSLYSVQDELLNPPDRIFLKQFGFGFDEKGVRAVAVLLCDLQRLSSEHQRIWQAKMLPGRHRFKLHPDYRKSILGHFPEGDSIFTAFLEEIRIIDAMTKAIRGKSMIREVFTEQTKPENLGFLILPTQREYDLFCHTLDRLISDNIDESFFDGEIQASDLQAGETLELLRGRLIRKLEIWLNKLVHFRDPGPKDDMFRTFRDIRSFRSKPAHAHFANKWDFAFYKQQQELVKRAYGAIRTLRLILANHPRSSSVEIPDWLFEGRIRTFWICPI